MQIRKFAVAAMCFGVFGASLFAETLTVTSNADSGEGTLRACLLAAADEDVIEIPESYVIMLESVMSTTNKNLIVRGLGKGATINGQDRTSVFFGNTSYQRVKTVTFENLVFTNCCGATGGVFPKSEGGAGTNKYRLENCRFLGNRATVQGGVFGIAGNWSMTDCDFLGNTAPCSGVFAAGNYTLSMTNCVFAQNSVTKDGAVFGATQYEGASGDWVFKNCVFTNNVAAKSGGVTSRPWRNLRAYNCVFDHNRATTGSSVFGANGATTVSAIFEDCSFCDNVTTSDSALFNISCNGDDDNPGVIVRRSKIARNSGLRLTLAASGSMQIVFENCLVEDNVATTSGGWWNAGMFGGNYSGSNKHYLLCISNSVFRNNANLGGDAGALYWGYCQGSNSHVRLYGSLFEGNYSHGAAACSIVSSNGFTLDVVDCTFKGNGISPDGVETNRNLITIGQNSASSSLRNCTFVDNWSSGIAYSSKGLVNISCTGMVDSVSSALTTRIDVDHCTFVSNHTLTVAKATPQILSVQVKYPGPFISNCAFVDNFDTAGNDLGLGGEKDGAVVSHCKLTGPAATPTTQTAVESGLDASSFKLGTFGANGIKTVLYGDYRLPTYSFLGGSCLSNAGTGSLARDARGRKRDNKPDIGAFELESGLVMFVK